MNRHTRACLNYDTTRIMYAVGFATLLQVWIAWVKLHLA